MGASVDEVLAVVEDQEHLAGLELLTECFEQGRAGPLAHPKRLSHGLRQERRRGQRSELCQGDAIVVLGARGSAHLERETRLAYPAWSCEREQTGVAKKQLDLGELLVTANETRQWSSQRAGGHTERLPPQWAVADEL